MNTHTQNNNLSHVEFEPTLGEVENGVATTWTTGTTVWSK